MSRPKLYLRKVETLRGNVAREVVKAGPLPKPGTVAPERRRGLFWAWLAGLARLTPGGRAGW